MMCGSQCTWHHLAPGTLGHSQRYYFVNIVWRQIATTPLISGGEIHPVEAVAEKEFEDELDLLAGIDA